MFQRPMVIICTLMALACPVSAEESSDTGFVSEDYELSSTDQNGVDIISGSVRLEVPLLEVGAEDAALKYSVITPSLAHTGVADDAQILTYGLPINTFRSRPYKFDNFSGGVSISGIDNCENWFELAGNRSDFCGTLASGLVAKDGTNESLEIVGADYVYTNRQGVRYISYAGVSERTTETDLGLHRIEYPDGRYISIQRSDDKITIHDNLGNAVRLQTTDNWLNTTVIGYNQSVDYCPHSASSCIFTEDWPTAHVYTGSDQLPAAAEDMSGRQQRLYPKQRSGEFSGYYFDRVKPIDAMNSALIEYVFCAPWADTSCAPIIKILSGANQTRESQTIFRMTAGKVRQVTRDGKVWEYEFRYSEF